MNRRLARRIAVGGVVLVFAAQGLPAPDGPGSAAAPATATPSRPAVAHPDGTCGLCVLAPSGVALNLGASGNTTLSGANVVVDSSDSSAVKVSGSGSLVAPSVGVVGGVTSSGGGTVQNLTTRIAPMGDPLALLAPPDLVRPSSVPSVDVGGSDSETISPGG